MLRSYQSRGKLSTIFKHIQVLIIDQNSVISAEMLSHINAGLKEVIVNGNSVPVYKYLKQWINVL